MQKKETIIGKWLERIRNSMHCETIVDTIALNTYSYVTAAFIELWIAQMDIAQHIRLRLLGILVNTATWRPYWLFRNKIFEILKINDESSFLKKYAWDTLSFTVFQLPIYCANMQLSWANIQEMIKASVSAVLITGLLWWPYWAYLDFLRREISCNEESNKKTYANVFDRIKAQPYF